MNNLMQRRRQQMQNVPMPQQDNSFNDWYNVGSAVGGAAFGGMADKKNDGKYGDSIVAGTGKTDKENFEAMQKYDNSPYATDINNMSYNDSVMSNIAQGGDKYVSYDDNGDVNWDGIGAFINGYQQASQPDVVGLEQGMQLGKQALNSYDNKNALTQPQQDSLFGSLMKNGLSVGSNQLSMPDISGMDRMQLFANMYANALKSAFTHDPQYSRLANYYSGALNNNQDLMNRAMNPNEQFDDYRFKMSSKETGH